MGRGARVDGQRVEAGRAGRGQSLGTVVSGVGVDRVIGGVGHGWSPGAVSTCLHAWRDGSGSKGFARITQREECEPSDVLRVVLEQKVRELFRTDAAVAIRVASGECVVGGIIGDEPVVELRA